MQVIEMSVPLITCTMMNHYLSQAAAGRAAG